MPPDQTVQSNWNPSDIHPGMTCKGDGGAALGTLARFDGDRLWVEDYQGQEFPVPKSAIKAVRGDELDLSYSAKDLTGQTA